MAIVREQRYSLKCDVCDKSGDFWSGTEEELLDHHRAKGWFIETDIPWQTVCGSCVSIAKRVTSLGLNALDLTTEPFCLGGRSVQ